MSISVLVAACPEEDDSSVDFTCSTDCDLEENHVYTCSCDINADEVYCDPFLALDGGDSEANTCVVDCAPEEDVDSACFDHCELLNVDDGLFAYDYQRIACSNTPPSLGSCGSWSPSSNISLSAGTYEVGGTWLAGVAAAPRPLWACDDAYFEGLSGGYFKVKAASSGEFLYELGLRTNDIPQTINGWTLETWNDAVIAFSVLYLSGEDNYVLIVSRGGGTTTLYYELT